MERMLEPQPAVLQGRTGHASRSIPADHFAAFLESRFQKTGLRPEPGIGAAIVELAGNLPYDVQRLAHEAWDDVRADGDEAVGLDQLHATLRRLLNEHDDALRERCGSGSRWRSAARCAPPCSRKAASCSRADVRARYRLSGTVDRSGVACRARARRRPRPRRRAATSSSTRCCANGSRADGLLLKDARAHAN